MNHEWDICDEFFTVYAVKLCALRRLQLVFAGVAMSQIPVDRLPALLGRPVAYRPIFTLLSGVSVKGALFLSQALFLTNTPTAQRRDGWFWKEQQGELDSWESETGMSAKTQVTARRQLINIGVLEEQRVGMPAKSWYRVNSEALAYQLALALGEADDQGLLPDAATACSLSSGESESAYRENLKDPAGSVQKPPTGVFLQRLQQRINPSLSDASAAIKTGAEVFQQAVQATDDGTPPPNQPRRFAMTLDWQPDTQMLAAACVRVGLSADAAPAPHQLAKFAAHHADYPERQHGAVNWHAKLADWLLNDQLAAAPNTTGGNHAQRSNASATGNGISDRDAVREQLARPHDTRWADGLWGEDDWAEPGA